MNKFYGNKMFVLIVSFFLTMILFIYVKTEVHNNSAAKLFTNVSEEVTETISEVPVHVTGNIDQYYVTGIPESVSVELKGPKNVINQTLESKKFRVVTEDLSKLGTGTHYVQFRMDNLSDEVSYRISPSTAEITISQLETQTFPVEVQLNNREGVAAGHEITAELTEPANVTLTGSLDTLQQIKRVYVNATLPNNQSSDYTVDATVITEDANGNVLNLTANPETVKVKITISPQGKQVPVRIETTNGDSQTRYQVTLPDNQQNVTLFGDQKALANITEVVGRVDVAGITNQTQRDVTLPVPNGASGISPQKIQVTIQASPDKTNSATHAESTSATTAQSHAQTSAQAP